MELVRPKGWSGIALFTDSSDLGGEVAGRHDAFADGECREIIFISKILQGLLRIAFRVRGVISTIVAAFASE